MVLQRHKTLSRVYYINDHLLRNVKTIYRLRKIGLDTRGGKPVYAYAISLAREAAHPLEEQVKSIYALCQGLLRQGETLSTEHKCLKLTTEEFEVFYCIELWRKWADRTAYLEDGQVKVELLRRMNCEQAAYRFKKHFFEPFALLNTLETLQQYKNPADKYTALAKQPLFLEALRKTEQ